MLVEMVLEKKLHLLQILQVTAPPKLCYKIELARLS